MTEDYGRRLLPSSLHHEAIQNPERLFAIVAKSNNIEDGFRHVTFQEVARAVNYVSNWILDRFAKDGPPSGHPTITYIGIPDLRYNIFFYAATQCRYKVFLPAPRSPVSVNSSLLQQTSCLNLVYASEIASVANGLQLSLDFLRCEQLPSLEELLSAPETNYAYDFQYANLCREPILVLHSSGSTGLPKPVIYTHGTLATFDARDFPTVPGRTNHDGLTTLRFSKHEARLYDVFPPFHIVGFMIKVVVPVFNLSVPIFGPPNRPPSGDLAAQIMSLYEPCGVVLPPSIVEQLFHGPGNIELFKKLDVLLYAGGPLPTIVGNELSKHTTLCQFYGSTETGQIRQLIPLPDDWAYIEFHPNESYELQSAGEGLAELVMFSSKDLEKTSSLYHNYPDIGKWHTKDLFEAHPSKPGLWKFHARNDDILVFSSGEKVNPIPMEVSMTAIPKVSGALMVGRGYPQSALLVELNAGTVEADVHHALWSAVNAANDLLPGHARVSRNMIIIANSDKPFQRAGKGTVMRAMTEKLYATEIIQLYESAPTNAKAPKITLKASKYDIEDVRTMLRSILESVSMPQDVGDEENLYSHGMDSIKTMETLNYLRTALLPLKPELDRTWLSLEILYQHPTINQLSSLLLQFLNESKQPAKRDRVAEMQGKIAEYIRRLPQDVTPNKSTKQDTYNVAVTGTTGFLGGYLLRRMVQNPRIGRIFCLNRSSTAQKSFEKLGISHTADMVFLQVNFGLERFGLSDADYSLLSESCHLVVHNAWKVDFNLSLKSFEDNLQSVKHMIDLSAGSPLHPRILFISSISSTGVWSRPDSVQQTIPERIVDDLSTTMQTGYAESKRVAEHVLNGAASQCGLPVTVVRLGQVMPSDDSTWPDKDVVPLFLQTCKSSGLLASDFVERIDWVPVDQAAETINDMIGHELDDNSEHDLHVFNLVNPQEQQWSSVLPTVQSWCGQNASVVSMKTWIEEVQKQDNGDAAQLKRLPALCMQHIYQMMGNHGPMHKYAMQKLMAVNGSIHKMSKLDAKQMQSLLQRL